MDNKLHNAGLSHLFHWMSIGVVVSVASLALVLGSQPWVDSATLNDPKAAPRTVSPRGELWPDERSTIGLFRQVSPAVVNITAIGVQRDLFTLNLYQIPQGTGSGFVWDTKGNIITNFHVIQNAAVAQVTLGDQSNWKAQVVGVAADKDLAVLRIDAPAERLRPIPLGTSKELQVGQSVFAIGNPFGLDQSLTTGVISALGREIDSVTRRPIQGVIQTDAAINPGNSGGPLLDSAGRLIGVNTQIYSPTGASAGIGFAIPVDTVNRIVPELIRSGKIIRPGLGVELAEEQIARKIGISGVLIVDVMRGGPAAKAGIRPTRRESSGRVILGDVITAIDGKKVESPNDLFLMLENRQVGDIVTVVLLRDGKTIQTKVTLEAVS
ncbi:MAG TPA: trypsin-like peptidase domain-containing protein [Candidatus Binatia bacterium]|nr:trypsin-like peptidase domain-containing protein [Candidatus Binatia bacterium]